MFIALVKYIHQDLGFQRHSLSKHNICSRHDMAEILLHLALNINQPINQPTNATSHIVVPFIKWVQLRREMIVCFAEIGTIADHHCLNFLFIMIIINYKRLWRNKHCGQLMVYLLNITCPAKSPTIHVIYKYYLKNLPLRRVISNGDNNGMLQLLPGGQYLLQLM